MISGSERSILLLIAEVSFLRGKESYNSEISFVLKLTRVDRVVTVGDRFHI